MAKLDEKGRIIIAENVPLVLNGTIDLAESEEDKDEEAEGEQSDSE